MTTTEENRQRASQLKLMVFDVDGVMSDGGLFYSDEGVETKQFNCRDGLGLRLLQNSGLQIAIITGRKARCVEHRMANLGIDLLYQGVNNKLATLHELLARLGLRAHEAGFMGDDIIDLQAMAACGFSAAPADSHPLALRQAGFVSSLTGGHGAVREVCEFILAAQGKLDAALAPYLPATEK